MMLVLAAAAIAVATSFAGGNVGRVETVTPAHLRVAVKGQADQANRNRQASWYYFRLDHAPDHEIRIDLTDLVGEYNFKPGAHAVTQNTRPVFSYDQRTWTHFPDEQVEWNEKAVELTLRFTPAKPTMWIAHMQPYTTPQLDQLLTLPHPHMKRGVVGRTVGGRVIPLLTITDPSVPEAGKKVVWLMARQHAWEAGTSWVADGAVRFLLSKDPRAAQIRRSTVFQVIPVFDIDGVTDGAVRFNRNGFDNNRNWDTAEPERMPEIFSVRKSLLDWLEAGHRIDVFYAMHNTESSDYVDGPAADPNVRPVADFIVKRLRESTNFLDPRSPRDSMSAPIDKSRYTVNQYLYKDFNLAAFLMELMVERHPNLGRLRTAQDFGEFGAALPPVLAGAAQIRE